MVEGQAERRGSHPVSACFVDLLKPGRDGDLVTFHVHHALLDQECQGAFNFLGSPAGTELIERFRHFPQHLSLADRLQGALSCQAQSAIRSTTSCATVLPSKAARNGTI